MVGIPLTILILQHFGDCPKPGSGFPTIYVMVFFCVKWLEVRGDCFVFLILVRLQTVIYITGITKTDNQSFILNRK